MMLSASTTPVSESPTILVVEDDVSVRHVLQNMLTHLGCRVSAAADTAAAVTVALGQPELTLALIDLSLDGCDGVDTVHILQELRPDILIVPMSGDPDYLLATQQSVGAPHALSKPFSLRDLGELVTMARCHVPQLKERCV